MLRKCLLVVSLIRQEDRSLGSSRGSAALYPILLRCSNRCLERTSIGVVEFQTQGIRGTILRGRICMQSGETHPNVYCQRRPVNLTHPYIPVLVLSLFCFNIYPPSTSPYRGLNSSTQSLAQLLAPPRCPVSIIFIYIKTWIMLRHIMNSLLSYPLYLACFLLHNPLPNSNYVYP